MTGRAGGAVRELGLIVVWPGARSAQEQMLRHIQELLEVRRVQAIHWSPERIAENSARFCRDGRVPPAGDFAREAPLLLVTVVDSLPRYVSRGGAQVNATFLEAQQDLSTPTRSGPRVHVHASVSASEARRDLMLLLGTDPKSHLEGHPRPWDGRVEEVRRDLTGAGGWRSPTELFDVLNQTVRYVVLRNFEGLPESLHVGSHEDVDLLTDDYPELARVMNARPHPRCIPRWGGPHWVRIAGEDMWFDLRFVGDHYYDPRWAAEILDRRVWNAGGFFSPGAEDYLESLAYHAVVHKSVLSADYRRRLATMAAALGRDGWEVPALEDPARVTALLDEILARRGAACRRPRDVNVFFNFEATGHRWPHLRRKLAGLVRKAVRIAHRVRRAPGAGYLAPPTPRPSARPAEGSAPPPPQAARRPAA
jgi:hypothetical protein